MVTFVARGAHLRAIQQRGLTVHSRGETWKVRVPSGDEIAELEPADLVVVAVKAKDTAEVARQVVQHLHPDSVVLSLQNGVSARGVLSQHIAGRHLIGGAAYISAFITAPGEVTHYGTLQKIVVGEYDDSRFGSAGEVYQVLAEAEIDAEFSDDITRVLWEKYVFLVGLSSTTSLTRASIGVVRSNPRSRELLHAAMAEVVAVGRAHGVNLSQELAQDRLSFCDTLPYDMTSSMANDLANGKPLELEWLSGNVSQLAGRLPQVRTPVNDVVAAALAPFEHGLRSAT
jgi:2-dehydropantoate 2-reductase